MTQIAYEYTRITCANQCIIRENSWKIYSYLKFQLPLFF